MFARIKSWISAALNRFAFEGWRGDAEKGDAFAQYVQGMLCLKGTRVPQDDAEAARWFRRAAEQGHAEAQNLLGALCLDGRGVKQDYVQALKWLRKAAAQGDLAAMVNLGRLFLEGNGVRKDHAEAAKWFRKPAERGIAEAQTHLGRLWSEGEGVPHDQAKAAEWFRKAADLGDAWGQYNLGLFYFNGKGVMLDYAEAVKWYRKAADQGIAEAHFQLGAMYFHGFGVAVDYVQAYIWMGLAVSQGTGELQREYASAQDAVAELLTSEQIAEVRRTTTKAVSTAGASADDPDFVDLEAVRQRLASEGKDSPYLASMLQELKEQLGGLVPREEFNRHLLGEKQNLKGQMKAYVDRAEAKGATISVEEIRQALEKAKADYKGDDLEVFTRANDDLVVSLRTQYGEQIPVADAVKLLQKLDRAAGKTDSAFEP